MDLPDKVSKEDALQLQNYTLEIELLNIKLGFLRKTKDSFIGELSVKYQMNPEVDTFDTQTLSITRAKKE